MKAIDRIKNKIKDTFLYEKQFNSLKNAIKLVRFNENYDKITAIHYEETKTLRFFKEYNFKKNDKLIDNHDNIYYVEEVKINQPFSIQLNILTKEEKEFDTTLVKYAKKEIEVPDSLKQCLSINTSISINANNSTFNDGLANYNILQTASYNQIFDFMKVLCNNTFRVKELQPFLRGIEMNMKDKKPIEEKWYRKFFKFMGTQLLEIAKQFITAYAASLAIK